MGNSVFHTGSRTEEPDSSSSEESDIETRLTSSDEEQTEMQPDQPSNYVSFLVSIWYNCFIFANRLTKGCMIEY